MAQVNLGHVVGPGVPSGGTAGQVLKKNGSTNYDTSWATLNSGNIPISASDNTTVQQSLAAVKSDMGIVEDGNTATHTISAGQYVIWKGALYTASAAIPSGTTLSSSNLTAVSDGGLNALNGKFARSGTFTLTTRSGTYTDGIYYQNLRWARSGNIVIIGGDFKLSGTPDASHMYAIFSGLPFKVTDVLSGGVARVSNSGKLLNGLRATQADTNWLSIYFQSPDGTFPTADNVIEIYMVYYTSDA